MNNNEPNINKNGKWIHRWIEMIGHSLQQPEIKDKLNLMILDPLVSYIINRIFPYVILTIILFSILFILVIVIFFILLFRENETK
jgi:hypothetical protein